MLNGSDRFSPCNLSVVEATTFHLLSWWIVRITKSLFSSLKVWRDRFAVLMLNPLNWQKDSRRICIQGLLLLETRYLIHPRRRKELLLIFMSFCLQSVDSPPRLPTYLTISLVLSEEPNKVKTPPSFGFFFARKVEISGQQPYHKVRAKHGLNETSLCWYWCSLSLVCFGWIRSNDSKTNNGFQILRFWKVVNWTKSSKVKQQPNEQANRRSEKLTISHNIFLRSNKTEQRISYYADGLVLVPCQA